MAAFAADMCACGLTSHACSARHNAAKTARIAGSGLTLQDLMHTPTIAALAARSQAAVVTLNRGVPGPVLYCLHAAMGTVMDYLPLAQRLNGRCTVKGVASRTLRDPAYRDVSLAQIADDYAALIRADQPQGPYLLIGWSLGGALAGLIAHRLETQGQQVAMLALIDPAVPGTDLAPVHPWELAFNEVLDMLFPGRPHAYALPAETGDLVCDEKAIRDVLEIVYKNVREVADPRYGRVGVPEVARMFLAGRVLARASNGLQEQLPSRLAVPVHCWWSTSRDLDERKSLRGQMSRCRLVEDEVQAAHADMPRARALLDALQLALRIAQADSVPNPLEEIATL